MSVMHALRPSDTRHCPPLCLSVPGHDCLALFCFGEYACSVCSQRCPYLLCASNDFRSCAVAVEQKRRMR